MSYFARFAAQISIALASAFTITISYALYYQHKQTAETQMWVVHTHEVREHIEKFLETTNEISLGQRGYLLTGDKNYLNSYNKALTDTEDSKEIDNDILHHYSIAHELHILHFVTDDNPYQQQNLVRLEKASQDLLIYAAASIDTYKNHGTNGLTGDLDQVRGKLIMDAIRRITYDMLEEEDQLLKKRTQLDADVNSRSKALAVGSIAVFYAGIVLLLLMLHRNTNQLKRKSKTLLDIVAIQREVAYLHHDLQLAMELIAGRMHIITDAEGGVIEMLEGDEMIYRAASGKAAAHVGMRLRAAGSLSGRCIQEQLTLKCDNAETDERVDKIACRKIGVTSMVVVPLKREKQAVGVLKVFSSRVNAFNSEHIAMLELMAGVLSAALSDALVTDRIRQSEETFRTAMHNASIGMALIQPDGTFKAVNKALCDLLGRSEEDILRADFQTLTHPDDLQENMEYIRRILAGEIQKYEMEKRYIHKDGHIIWALLNVSLVANADGTPKHFISQIQDITARKQLITKLNQSNSQLGRFAYIASHDMQEPLRMLSNFALLIDSEYGDKLDETGKEYIKIVTDSAIRMQSMVAGLLEYARVGKGAFNVQEIDVAKDIKHILASLSQAIKDCNASVTYDALPVIKGNPVQFTSLLQNLVSNGLKYQAPGVIPYVHIGVEDKGSVWEFQVKDNGIGMAEEYMTRIFEPFVRLHSWQEYKGTGIGLSIAKEIVENHGGKIWATSQPGKGSTFHFTIPK